MKASCCHTIESVSRVEVSLVKLTLGGRVVSMELVNGSIVFTRCVTLLEAVVYLRVLLEIRVFPHVVRNIGG